MHEPFNDKIQAYAGRGLCYLVRNYYSVCEACTQNGILVVRSIESLIGLLCSLLLNLDACSLGLTSACDFPICFVTLCLLNCSQRGFSHSLRLSTSMNGEGRRSMWVIARRRRRPCAHATRARAVWCNAVRSSMSRFLWDAVIPRIEVNPISHLEHMLCLFGFATLSCQHYVILQYCQWKYCNIVFHFECESRKVKTKCHSRQIDSHR